MSRKKATEEKSKPTEAPETSANNAQKNQENEEHPTTKKDAEEINSEENCEEARQDAEDEQTLLKKQLEDLSDKHLRLIAEYDNFRKRTLKEKMELSKSAGEGILLSILPVIDDFDRARAHLGTASDLDAVKNGIDLIYNKFNEFLKQQGIVEIETENQEFDSETHEAITKIPAPSEDMKGKIIDCVQKGYKLNDKVIRYPKVVVGE
ncbi:nucleotide exchange factor GrpE [Marinilabilia sp.]|uniref:nucleotide exchange factor GrpE n=1 Tax=Marinilabilia sp. TaxID=2021252 RepID=UPI0025C6683B|nr:nucleotide exchange factor GrpE [Marinilabilia sp.]